MPVTYETSFTMRGATGITLQPHQILRLPRKITLQNLRHLYGGRFDHDPNMTRPWSDHEIAKLNPSVRRAYFSPLGNAFCIANYNVSRSGYLPRFHRILRLPQKVTLQDHQILRLPRKGTLQDHQMLRLPQKVTLEDHQILPLPRKMNWNFTELLLYWAGTLLSWYFTLLYFTLLYFTLLYFTLLYFTLLYFTLLYFTLLYWTATLLNCYFTELVLYWAGTLLSWYFTELVLYWAVTLLSCYFTELLLNWAVT